MNNVDVVATAVIIYGQTQGTFTLLQDETDILMSKICWVTAVVVVNVDDDDDDDGMRKRYQVNIAYN